MKSQITFKFTTPIVRYLEVISEKYEQRRQDIPDEGKVFPFECVLQTYTGNESYTNYSEPERLNFIEYFSAKKAAVFQDGEQENYRLFEDDSVTFKNDGQVFHLMSEGTDYPDSFRVVVLDIAPFLTALSEYKRGLHERQINQGTWEEDTNLQYSKAAKRLVYHQKNHVFQKRTGRSLNIRLFELLWENREHKRGSKVYGGLHGKALAEEGVLRELKLDESSTLKIRGAADYLNKTLVRTKGFPLKITRKGGMYLMTVQESG